MGTRQRKAGPAGRPGSRPSAHPPAGPSRALRDYLAGFEEEPGYLDFAAFGRMMDVCRRVAEAVGRTLG